MPDEKRIELNGYGLPGFSSETGRFATTCLDKNSTSEIAQKFQ